MNIAMNQMCTVNTILELIFVRERIFDLDGFSSDDINNLIKCLCSS